MLERLKKLEGSGLTALPPPPVAGPAVRPSFGPDRPAQRADGGPQRFRLRRPRCKTPRRCWSAPPPGGVQTMPAAPSGIVSIALGDGAPAKGAKPGRTDAVSDSLHRATPAATCPSGAFTRAAPARRARCPHRRAGPAQSAAGAAAPRRTTRVLPNQFRARVKECFVVGAGFGDVSSERAYIRTESLSCITRDGTAIDVPVKGYVAGEDGKAGMRGRLVSKQGQILANALLAGVASGIGHAFTQSSTTTVDLAAGHDQHRRPRQATRSRLGTGVGKALDRLAQYYITPRREGLPGDRDRRRTHRRRRAHPGYRPARVAADAAAQDAETYPQLADAPTNEGDPKMMMNELRHQRYAGHAFPARQGTPPAFAAC